MRGLVYFLVAIGVKDIGASNTCTKESFEPAWDGCEEQYKVTVEVDENVMRQQCARVECLIQCKTDAVGDCQNREEFRREHLMMFDTEKWKVYYRLICAHAELLRSERDCIASSHCTPSEAANLFNPAIKEKSALCSMYAKMRDCVSVSPGGNCTAAGAKYVEEVRKLGYSVSICDNTDIKHIYQKYGGDLKCGTSSSERARAVTLLQAISFILYCCCVLILK